MPSHDAAFFLRAEMRQVVEHPSALAVDFLMQGFDGRRGAADADAALEALRGGFEDQGSISNRVIGARVSFVDLCLGRRHLDVLVEALEHPHPSFVTKQVADRAGWLQMLCSTGGSRAPECLLRLAHRHLGIQAQAAYALALEVDPCHPDAIAFLREAPEAAAVVTEIAMRKRLSTSLSLPTLASPSSPSPRRRVL